ncbi:MAG: hemerythrin domain-containing protein, partial [Ilumatobacteraceae bacterium]
AAGTAKKATGAAKKAVEPVTRAAGAAKRTATRGTGTTKRSAQKEADAIRMLIDDHRQVEELFVRFEKTGAGAHKRRQGIVERITEALSVHASVEEEIFYPAARRFVADATDDVLEALEEHHLVKVTLAELETMDPSNERYGAKVTVLIENVRHHVEEEEGELFPTVRTALTKSQLSEIGDELADAKRTAPKRPHPEAPDTPPGNIVAQVLTAPLDAAANLNKAAARRIRDVVS